MTADREPYAFAVRRLDAIFSAANDYEEGAKKMRDEFVVIPRANLPEVVEDEGNFHVDGIMLAGGVTAAQRRQIAHRNLAVAEHIDAWEAEAEAEAAKEAEAAARRDALANELSLRTCGSKDCYHDLGPLGKLAVDWLIEAQDRLAEYEEVQA